MKKACWKNIKQNNKLLKLSTPSFSLPIVPTYPPSLAVSISTLTNLQRFSSFSNNDYYLTLIIFIFIFRSLTFPFVRKWIRYFWHVLDLNWCSWNLKICVLYGMCVFNGIYSCSEYSCGRMDIRHLLEFTMNTDKHIQSKYLNLCDNKSQ